MAALNVSFSLKFPPKPSISFAKPHFNSSSFSSLISHSSQIEFQKLQLPDNKKDGSLLSLLEKPIASASLILFLSASLCISHPAIAFKGGGPYGQGVTRGQDLSGKDFSGLTLIKQDFKTVNLTNANLEGAVVTGNTSFRGSVITGAETINGNIFAKLLMGKTQQQEMQHEKHFSATRFLGNCNDHIVGITVIAIKSQQQKTSGNKLISGAEILHYFFDSTTTL
ncbi:Thylakoid lumenal 15 kDa protein 1 chloroplastic [Bienertia sinuspersici]